MYLVTIKEQAALPRTWQWRWRVLLMSLRAGVSLILRTDN